MVNTNTANLPPPPPAARASRAQRPAANLEPKISTAEALLLTFFAIIADLINWIPIVNIISAVIAFFITQFYFRMKGLKATANLVMQLMEFIPFVSILPLTTAGVATVIFIDRHPEVVRGALGAATAMVPGGELVKGAGERALGVRAAPQLGGAATPGGGLEPSPRPQQATHRPQLAKSVPLKK